MRFLWFATVLFICAPAIADEVKTDSEKHLHFTRCPNYYGKPKERPADDKAKYDYVLEKRADGKTYMRKVAKKHATTQTTNAKKSTKS